MSNPEEVKVAEDIRNAYAAGAIAPVSARLGETDIAAAYRVQAVNTDYWVKQGRRIVGKKIGLTSPVVQKQLGVDQPDFGILFGDMLVEDGARADADKLLAGRIEAEVAIGLKSDLLGTDISEADLRSAISWLAPALEIVDSRIRDWKIKITDTVADNASSAAFVLGKKRHWPVDFDVVDVTMRMRRDGEVVSEGKGSACLGSPLISCLWLAREMAKRGNPLRAGEVVLSGALGPMVGITKGAAFEADIDHLGTVGVRF